MCAHSLSDVLGVPMHGSFASLSVLNEINRGLPLASLDRVADAVAPDDAAFPHRLVPRATLARRRQAQTRTRETTRLTPEESARVARLAEVWTMAVDVWGSETEARMFLFREHPLLEGKAPVDVVLANEFGRPLVEGILGRLQYGSAV